MKILFILLISFSFYSHTSFSTSLSDELTENLYAPGDSLNKPLSVILLDFQATLANEEIVKLQWMTANEKDSDVFIIERSTDGILFQAVAQTQAAKSSSHIVQYDFTDAIVSYSQAYYRLKLIDLKGQIFYSKVVEAYSKPNPVALKF